MSKTKQILELCSPTLRTKTEHLKGLTQTCNYCSGNGWFWGMDEHSHESVKVPCPMCGGAGKMYPEITIEWKPSNKKKYGTED
mgnify:CR=1 FL=1